MRTRLSTAILLMLTLALTAPPAQAGGGVTVCDEAHLLAALAGGGTVTFACSGVITLTATIIISADTTIDGSGQEVAVSGNNVVRVFSVEPGVTLTLSRLNVINGFVTEGGGGAVNNSGGTVIVTGCAFSGNSAGGGGAISNSNGSVYVYDSTFSGNQGIYVGGGIYTYGGIVNVSNSTFTNNSTTIPSANGGAICLFDSMLTVSSSTFSNNSATGHGGAISSGMSLTGMIHVSNSTLYGNSAAGYGGGIYSGIPMTVTNSTLSGNNAADGGGIAGQATLRNTIIANSQIGGNCIGTFIDGGGNLSYPNATCPGINADPLLGPLQDNGGPTWTMALGEGSAAIDAGDDAICAAPPVNNLDQRGVTRPQGLHCDIGAVEQIIEPTAVSLDGISAGSVPGALPPIMVFGLLLIMLAGIGVNWRRRSATCR